MNFVHFMLVLSQLISQNKCINHNTKLLDASFQGTLHLLNGDGNTRNQSGTKNDNNVVSQVKHVAKFNTEPLSLGNIPSGQKFTNDVSVATNQLLAAQRFKDDIGKKNRSPNCMLEKRNMRSKREALLPAQSVDRGTGCYLLYNKERDMFLTVSGISLPPKFQICDNTWVHNNSTNRKCYEKVLYSSNIQPSNCNLEPDHVLNLCFIFYEENGELHSSFHCKVPLKAVYLHCK